MKSLPAILIILCLLIAVGAVFFGRHEAAAAPAPAVEPAPVQTNQIPPPAVSEVVGNPAPIPATNEAPANLTSDSVTNPAEAVPPEKTVSTQAVIQTISAITNPPPSTPATNEDLDIVRLDNFTNFTVVPERAVTVFTNQPVAVFTNRQIADIIQKNPISTNRIALALRFGLNISGKFKDVGRSFSSGTSFSGGRRTPDGDPYNYDDGYVLTDSSGNFGGQSWYWGYDNASQVNAGAHTIAFNRTVATGLPSQNSADDSPYVGAELTYDRELGVKEDWHHLHYGIESAFNFLPIEFNSGCRSSAVLSQQTDTYGYMSGTTPPPAPYQGSFGGPGFVINVPPVSSSTTLIPGATFLAQQHFEANLWGLRLGPYLEMPVSHRLDLFLTGGLAVGLLDGDASWHETLTLPGGGGSLTANGGGHDTSLLWGFYLGLNAAYQFTERWSVEAGAQYQNLGTYDHNFGGRVAELDLNKSLFVHVGIGYSF